MRTTYMAKPNEVEKKWYVVDAAGKPLGRVASQVAAVLRGKNKPTFTPNVDCGDYVIVINAKDAVLTGKKLTQKIQGLMLTERIDSFSSLFLPHCYNEIFPSPLLLSYNINFYLFLSIKIVSYFYFV